MAHCSQIRARTFQRIPRKVWARRYRYRLHMRQRRGRLHPFSCPLAREYRSHIWWPKATKAIVTWGDARNSWISSSLLRSGHLRHRRYKALDLSGEGEYNGCLRIRSKGMEALMPLEFVFFFFSLINIQNPGKDNPCAYITCCTILIVINI